MIRRCLLLNPVIPVLFPLPALMGVLFHAQVLPVVPDILHIGSNVMVI